MNKIKIALLITSGTIAILMSVYAYYGGFHKINIHTEITGGETIVYKNVTGDYKQTSQITDEIYYYLLNSLKVQTYKGFGIFYDNPQTTETDKLRSEAGCIIEEKDKNIGVDSKYKKKTLPQKKYIVTQMPFNGSLSIFIGIMKVYPALEKYGEDHNINPKAPVTEIYDIPNKKIIYRIEI